MSTSTIKITSVKPFDYFHQRVLNKLWAIGHHALGRTPRTLTHDRKVLEESILPFLTQPRFQHILFVGCDWYTQSYNSLFKDRDYWTIDGRKTVTQYGGPNHIVGLLQDIEQYFDPEYFDAIVCNGVYGYGLDHKPDIERAIKACETRLRDGGLFVLGWNATPERTPVPLSDISSLQQLRRHTFAPLGTSDYLTRTRNRHVFSFYQAHKR